MAACPRLLVRADASTLMGAGHVMRTLAVAQGWRLAGGEVTYICCSLPSTLRTRLKREGCQLELWKAIKPGSSEDALRTRDLAERIGANATVVDGYHFGSEFRRKVAHGSSAISLAFHDYGIDEPLWFDYLLNPNPHAHPLLYPKIDVSQQLLGLAWVPLRREFLEAAQRRVKSRDPRLPTAGAPKRHGPIRVLVTLGGGDQENLTGLVLAALNGLDAALDVRIVVGPVNPRLEALRSRALDARHPTRVHHDVADMPRLMAWADLAVASAGSTAWELAWMGVPWVGLAFAENQRPILEALATSGIAMSIGWHCDVDEAAVALAITDLVASPERRQRMASRGVAAIDGCGVRRIVELLLGHGNP